jgi:EAL domain-containing protein (putative c-di-GMP-specific phosphodiesterase class I)/GGDEF domain-containing protein
VHLRRLDRVTHAYGAAAVNELRRDIGERLSAGLGPQELLAHPDDRTFSVVSPVAGGPGPGADGWLTVRARDLIASLRAEPFAIGGDVFEPDIGVGVSRAPDDSGYAHELMVMADEAAARSSQQRSNRIAWPDHQAMAAKRQRLSLEAGLRRAVSEGLFSVYYQPIVDLRAGARVVGAEALARWPQPEGQAAIGPEVFIPLAEELDLMDSIGRYVFESSCQQLRRWQDQPGGGDFWVSVNLAPAQLQDPELASRFAEIAHAAGVSPSNIKLEITESAFEDGFEVAGRVIDELAAAGFPLALDDFGTGHSSLNRLINMPFTLLKVDRSFVWQSPDGAGAAVVSSLSQLAGSLKLASLGEGVETPAHDAYLRQCGYAYAQGYLYGRPVPAAELAID